MKRNVFSIKINGVEVARKNAWNSSLREMPKLISKTIPSGSAREVSKETVRLDPWSFKSGRFVWMGSNGAEYIVEIELIAGESLEN